MRNLNLVQKMAILVGVLVATILAVAIVGGRQTQHLNAQLSRMVNVTNRAVNVTAQTRNKMLASIRAEKNAILANDHTLSQSHADYAEARSKEVDQLLPILRDLIGTLTVADERQDLEDFRQGWEAFKRNQTEVLKLARLKTNVQAKHLMNGELREHLATIQRLLGAVKSRSDQPQATPDGSTELESIRRAGHVKMLIHIAGERTAQILSFVHTHIDAERESDMNQLDIQIAEGISGCEATLDELKALVDESDRLQISEAMAEVQSVRKVTSQIQDLSRTNSNVRATELTTTTMVELTTKCDDALARLLAGLAKIAEADQIAAHASYIRSLVIIGATGFLGISAGLFLGWWISGLITGPARQGVMLADALAHGDLTRRLDLEQRDEIGQLTRAIDSATCNFAKIIAEIHKVSEEIDGSADELGTVSNELLSQSEEMSTQASFVAGSMDQMTSSVNTMAAAAEQMSMNVASISSASEEISVNVGTISSAAEQTSLNVGAVVESIQETTHSFEAIASDAREGAQVTSKASQRAAQATDTMKNLDRSAGEISKVTEMIKLIAIQTNLLALNATIEATSAGEAGRGFAVVANEIKELANQSGKAAEDIARMIEGVQGNTRDAVTVIQEVSETIQTINTFTDRIFQAVETETRAAARSAETLHVASEGVSHIARSINEVAKGATDMSRNSSEAAKAANDVSNHTSQAARGIRETSSNIHGVNQATKLSTASAQRVNEAATHLQTISAKLDQIVRQFKVPEHRL